MANMKMLRWACLSIFCLGVAQAQPLPNPPFLINKKITAAQVDRGGRVDLDYDFRGFPAKTLVVTCYRYQGPAGTSAVQEWKLTAPKGKERLNFKEMPTSQYLFTGVLLDAQDQPLPLQFRPVQLEYGGWNGRLRVAEATQRASMQQEVPLGDARVVGDEHSDYVFKVTPEALVVLPGRNAVLTATLNGRPVAEGLEWFLEGPGKLTVVENFTARYVAPKDAKEGERATIRVWVARQSQMRQTIQVLLSREAPEKTP